MQDTLADVIATADCGHRLFPGEDPWGEGRLANTRSLIALSAIESFEAKWPGLLNWVPAAVAGWRGVRRVAMGRAKGGPELAAEGMAASHLDSERLPEELTRVGLWAAFRKAVEDSGRASEQARADVCRDLLTPALVSRARERGWLSDGEAAADAVANNATSCLGIGDVWRLMALATFADSLMGQGRRESNSSPSREVRPSQQTRKRKGSMGSSDESQWKTQATAGMECAERSVQPRVERLLAAAERDGDACKPAMQLIGGLCGGD